MLFSRGILPVSLAFLFGSLELSRAQDLKGETPMLGRNDIIAFIGSTDPDRAKHFYQKVLGLQLVSDEKFALVFDANGTMLRVSIVKEIQSANYTVLGWRVPDIRAAIQRLTTSGVVFERFPGLQQDDLGIWTAHDKTQVAWFKDPDGNILSLTQFP